jgi:putative acetyltransferase
MRRQSRLAAMMIRPATNEDREAIQKLVFGILQEYQLCADPNDTDADLADLTGFYFQRGGCFDVLVTDDGKIVGTVGLHRLSANTCELRKMYLDRTARGQGYGRRLLEHALRRARESGYSEIVLETALVLKDAIRMYEQYNFQPYTPQHKSKRCDVAYRLKL